MTPQQLEARSERSTNETLIISQIDEGFRVYSPAAPTRSYVVSGTPESPACTCPDFRFHRKDPDWRCKHILAVLGQVNGPETATPQPDPEEAEERRAIQGEGSLRESASATPPPNGPTQMLLKRSVSPDGRIDSLSVEFDCPVERATARDIKSRAIRALKLQAEIVEGFLDANGRGRSREEKREDASARAVPAEMLDIGGMDTRWGRRLFINVKANGRTLKLFGSEKQLSEAIEAAGYPDRTDFIEEGVDLNLPCRVVTKPSEDGKYLNIVKVQPATTARVERRARQ